MIRVISYNLRKNRAWHELENLAGTPEVDAICLQEVDTTALPAELGPLHLADSTKRNRLGLALYYRRDRYDALQTKAYSLKRSLHDVLLSPAHERLIGSHLVDRESGHHLVVASFHAAPLTALNSLRRNQIRAAHESLRVLGDGVPIIMVGDYNYPLFKGNLAERVTASGYDLSLSDRRTYTRYKFFRGHFDFVTSVGLTIEEVTTMPRGTSDHLPILVRAAYTEAGEARDAAKAS